jgi:hypothetical protein
MNSLSGHSLIMAWGASVGNCRAARALGAAWRSGTGRAALQQPQPPRAWPQTHLDAHSPCCPPGCWSACPCTGQPAAREGCTAAAHALLECHFCCCCRWGCCVAAGAGGEDFKCDRLLQQLRLLAATSNPVQEA